MITFQRGLFNTSKSLCDIQEMYFRTNARNLDYKNSIILNSGHFFSTDTYFNSISVGKIKKYTVIENVYLSLKAKGNFFLKIYHINDSLEKLEMFSKRYNLNELAELNIELEQWSNLSDGLLYFVIHAIDITSLYDFSYLTSTQPTQEVKLAIVITHFNRQQYLLPALERIENELLNFSEFSNIGVIVSDNSENLEFQNNDKIKIYKNKNYGGSGGFAFGLLKSKDQGFTHCLFMDDDASTEMESIKRVFNLFQYSKTKDTAIIGAMLYEDRKNIQYESGAILRNNLEPLHTNLDLKFIENIIINQVDENIADYGGWWFFAFPILNDICMPFPFFVRGDDIAFGLSNKFNLFSINGICSWQEDFLIKNNCFMYYQYIRSMLILYYSSLWKINFFNFLKFILISLITTGVSYRYDLMKVILVAIRDILSTDEWDNNINMVYKFSELSKKIEMNYWVDLNSLNLSENDLDKVNAICFSQENPVIKSSYGGLINNLTYMVRLCIIFFSFFGMLIPKFMFKSGNVFRPVNDYSVKHAFLNKKVFLINNKSEVMIIEVNKTRFIFYFLEFMALVPRILWKNKSNKTKYKFFLKKYTTENFWRNIFKEISN